jgi:hypothetical protein
MMKKLLTAVAILACMGTLAVAGPNEGGTIFVHYSADAVYPGPDPVFVPGGLNSLADVNTQAPGDASGDAPILWFAYAAFNGCAQPRVAVVSFGCEFNADLTGLMWWATEPGASELRYEPQSGEGIFWPYPGTGTLLGFASAHTALIDEIYCFAGYGPEGETFGLGPNPDPVQGGVFADDGSPSVLDPIAGFGTMGFGVPGIPALPVEQGPGACCFCDGHCEFVCQSVCDGTFLGEGITCYPNPCPGCVMGACCFMDLHCEVLTQEACVTANGTYMGDFVPCTPGVCDTPVERSTWGQIKNIYR